MSADLTFRPRLVTEPPPRVISQSANRHIQVATGVQQALRGKLNATGRIDLVNDGVKTTTVVDCDHCTAESVVLLTPETSAAGAELGSLHVVPTAGRFTVHHGASVSTRTFGVVVLG